MERYKLAKQITGLVVNSSVHTSISQVLRNNMNEPVTKWQKVKFVIGPFMIASAVADSMDVYTERKFEDVFGKLRGKSFDRIVEETKDSVRNTTDQIFDPEGAAKKRQADDDIVVPATDVEEDLPQEG